MKRFFLLIAVVCALGTMSAKDCDKGATHGKDNTCECACKCGKVNQGKKDRTAKMAEELNLDKEQVAKIEELNKKYATLFKRRERSRRNVDGQTGATANQQRQRPSQEEMEKQRTERKAMQKEYDEELKKILTSDQYNTYKDGFKNQRKGKKTVKE